MKITNDELNAIAEIAVKRIKEEYFLVKKPRGKDKMYGIDFIERCVWFIAEKTDVSYDEIMDTRQTKPTIDAKMIVYYIVRKNMTKNVQIKQIGAFFNKHHASILNAMKVVDSRMKFEPSYKRTIEGYEKEFIAMYHLEKTIKND